MNHKHFVVIGFLLFFLGLFLIAFNFILLPAYYSVIGECTVNGNKIAESNGYKVGGTFTINYNTNNTSTENCSQPQLKIAYTANRTDLLRHELCHLKQYTQHRIYGCDNLIGIYKNEAECYLKQHL